MFSGLLSLFFSRMDVCNLSPARWLHRRVVLSGAALLAVTLVGCGRFDGPQSYLDPKGPLAQDQFNLFMITVWVTLFIFITVGGVLAWTTWRYRLRRDEDPKAIPAQMHGHPAVEIGLIIVSAALLVIIAIPTLRGIAYLKIMPEEYREDAVEVLVTGYQWWWKFEYPELGIETANEMVFPVDRAVHLRLRAADVQHSFWVPKLAGKTDLIPGQENIMWIKADEPGDYFGQCAEFCGDSHAYMLFRAQAVPPAEFDAWVENHRSGPTIPTTTREVTPAMLSLRDDDDPQAKAEQVQLGITTFQQKCSSCHKIGNAGGVVGPNLTHMASRTTLAAGWIENNPVNLARWIARPDQVKPGNYMWLGYRMPGTESVMAGIKDIELSAEEVNALVAYLGQLH